MKRVGVSGREIDRLLEMMVCNDTGHIDLKVFISKICRLE